ncbi:glycosyltransferase family 39 protein [uncultured Shewanella sp.]|uniref:ArnT family glycosyltransferase n=1 Tax=uncultured Shewanella sp. TaxID=173975 RepID=UPI00260CA814|nr:glycosyltransferase family 39 protein [uncultured Shewanella sp.]
MNNEMPLPQKDYYQTLIWLLIIGFIVIFAGVGLRDPWPADEPRFVEVAREMVASGNWFFPQRGGEFYPDKPPIFMWSMAILYLLTGSLSWTFLLPNAVASLITLLCVYDLGARLWDIKVAKKAAILLLIAPQFIIQAKTAQIDAMVACWITISMYGLIRHFFVAPSQLWYLLAWFFMGLGVLTKGVGFLPVFFLIPIFALHYSKRYRFDSQMNMQLFLGPLVLLMVLLAWLTPILYFSYTSDNPDFAAYRDNILFKQTAERYVNSWGHIKPWYFFFISVIPLLWFPLYLLMINKGFWRKLTASPVAISLLIWVGLVVVFFSLSPGKRNLYILPALPMFALLVGACCSLSEVKKWFNKVLASTGILLTSVLVVGFFLCLFKLPAITRQVGETTGPLALLCLSGAVIWIGVLFIGIRQQKQINLSLYHYAVGIGLTWVLYGLVAYPVMNDARTPAKAIMTRIQQDIAPNSEVGLARFKEQFLLFSPMPLVHFSYLASPQEQDKNAWLWMKEKPNRYVLTQKSKDLLCFDPSKATDLGIAHRRHWLLFGHDAMLATCPKPQRVQRYVQAMKQIYQ